MSTLNPFDDTVVPSVSDQSANNEPTPKNELTPPEAFSGDSDVEQLHSFIDTEPQQISDEEVHAHAEEFQNAAESREQRTLQLPASPGHIQELMIEYFNDILNKQKQAERLLQKFDVSLLRAEAGYHIRTEQDETYLLQVSINESRKINLLTLTFSDGVLVQIELLGPTFTKLPPENNPFMGLYGHLLSLFGLGDVYKLHARYVVLAANHPYPVTIDRETIELNFVENFEIRLIPE